MAIAPDVHRSVFDHFVGIDWSGAIGARQKGIAVALCQRGSAAPELVRPGHIWSRHEVCDWLLNGLPSRTLVGLDLGASLPFIDGGAFFPGWSQSPPTARALWALVERLCADDPHLSATSFVDHPEVAPHFRRHGGRRGLLFEGNGRLRVTDEAQRAQGLNPCSNFNLIGASQVGKSSLTGMRVLQRLDGRLPIWPFERPGARSCVVEIYTTVAALAAGRAKGRAKMRSWEELDAALLATGSEAVGAAGPVDDHKSDALLTAAWLRTVADRADLWHPAALTPHIAATEGWTFGIA